MAISPVTVINGERTAPFIFVCEHASAHIPEEFDGLGLPDTALASHIAWDPGAEAVTRQLSAAFNSPAVLGRVSRLVYDCNRPPEAPDAIPSRSEIFEIPGNQGLTTEQIAGRIECYYRPFEEALRHEIEAHHVAPTLVTLHSFTPVYEGQKRTVELGILHDEDQRLANAMLSISGQHTDLNTQRNQPYGPEDGVTHTLRLHGLQNNLLNVMIEIRSDLLETSDHCTAIATMLEGLLAHGMELCSAASASSRVSA